MHPLKGDTVGTSNLLPDGGLAMQHATLMHQTTSNHPMKQHGVLVHAHVAPCTQR